MYVYVCYVCAKWQIYPDDTHTTKSIATREKTYTRAERIVSSLARIVSRVLHVLFLLHVQTYLDYKECRRTVRYFCSVSILLIRDVPRRRRGFSTLFLDADHTVHTYLAHILSQFDREYIVRRWRLLLERPCAILRRLLSPIEPISRYSIVKT